ncbi:5-(carboxyamino)imidazole ribonucleotide synthase [uncultured Hyphomicrobium sp.]|uniref:5-(carboxyamino)imidazole ribonucleotide synthase n=1 Tax=uncultured Hyphomicrobium sp. TaxID=194373 RepID=UPI0025DFAC87|nr:5-(carboxyamino)imidazole ribonucleotide synthase [uncultured Hyphomicrobium sp.]
MTALAPGSTIGIMGGGQLGRMLSLAAAQLGLKCHIYSDVPGGACDVAAASTIGPYEDVDKVRAFAASVDVVTYEFENVPLQAAAAAEAVAPVRPGPKALAVAQDRLEEKTFISALGIPVAPFAAVDSSSAFETALATIGHAGILKTRRLGYDGKGQVRIRSAAELAPAFDALQRAPSVLEGLVPFAYEVSVLVVRAVSGEVRFYDIPLNTHKDGILDTSTVPSPLPAAHATRATDIAGAIAAALDYVGVLGVEMFYLPDAPEPLVVNEIAPRVHNSGHWTMDACLVSQFENHIRAVADWPLGPTGRHADVTMTNLIGDDAARWHAFAAEPNAAVHLYGKPEPRPGRKMGHVNRLRKRS